MYIVCIPLVILLIASVIDKISNASMALVGISNSSSCCSKGVVLCVVTILTLLVLLSICFRNYTHEND